MPKRSETAAEKVEREWREGLDGRLRLLIRKHGPSQAKFAKACGIDAPRVTAWLAGEAHRGRGKRSRRTMVLPSAKHLKQVADAVGVSIDWLLFGDGGEGPVYRNQSVSDFELEAELAERVARKARWRVAKAVSPRRAGTITAGAIDAGDIIDNAVDVVVSNALDDLALAPAEQQDAELAGTSWAEEEIRRAQRILAEVKLRRTLALGPRFLRGGGVQGQEDEEAPR